MPMIHTDAEKVVSHKGVTVYHTYKDGEYRSDFWYTLDSGYDDWESEAAFDVRDLDVDIESEKHEDILRAAIDAKVLTNPLGCGWCGESWKGRDSDAKNATLYCSADCESRDNPNHPLDRAEREDCEAENFGLEGMPNYGT